MSLRTRVKRLEHLERERRPARNIPCVCVDLPDGQPDKALIDGEWQPVPDGHALLQELYDAGLPVKVYGFDPDKEGG